MFKKLFNTTMALALVASSFAPVVSVLADAQYPSERHDAFDFAKSSNLTQSASLEQGDPFGTVTRVQAARFFSRFADNFELLSVNNPDKNCSFSDISNVASDLKADIARACELDIFNGENGKFMPSTPLTKRVAYMLLYRVMNEGQKESSDMDAYAFLADMDIARGEYATEAPKVLNRIQTFMLLQRVADSLDTPGSEPLPIECLLDPELPQCVTDPLTNTGTTNTGVVNEVKAGTLNVSLDSATPASRTVPMTATAVPFTTIKLTAGSNDITVRGLQIKRAGAGNVSDVLNVYLYRGTERITDGRTVSSNTNTARFANLNMTIKAGQSETLTVRADLSGGSSNQHMFGLDTVDLIDSSALTVNGLPVMGNPMTLANVTIGKVTITPRSVANTQVSVGDQSAEIGKFNIAVDSIEGASFQAITLALAGNIAANNVTDLKLVDSNGVVIATANAFKRAGTFDAVAFNLTTPIAIERGSDRTYSVKATLAGGRNADTVGLYLANNTDLLLQGATFGSNLAINSTASTLFGNNNTFSTLPASILSSNQFAVLKAGRLTFTYLAPNTQNVSRGMTNVVLAAYNVNNQSGQPIDMRVLTMNLSGTDAMSPLVSGGISTFQNIRLVQYIPSTTTTGTGTTGVTYSIGNILSSASDPTNAFSQDLRFADSFTVNPGQTQIAVIANIPTSTPVANAKYQVSFNPGASAGQTFRSVGTNESISTNDIVPSVALNSNISTILGSALTISYSSLPTTTFVVGTNQQVVGILNAQASDAMNVTVNSFTVQAGGTIAGGQARNTVSSLMVYDLDTMTMLNGISSNSIDANGNVTFSNLGYVVPRSTTKKLALVANISSNVAAVTNNGSFSATGFDITQSVNGSTVTASIGGTPSVFNVIGSGSVTIATIAGSNNRIQGGAANQVLGQFSFRANRIAYDIKTLSFAYSGTNASVSSVPSTFRLVDANNMTNVIATASLTTSTTNNGGVIRFSNMSYRLPQDQTRNLLVVADFNAINNNTNSAANGQSVQLGLYANVGDNQDDVEFAPVASQGLASIKDAGVNYGVIAFNGGVAQYSNAINTLVRSIPVISAVSLAGEAGNIPNASTPLIIKVTNGSANDITLGSATLSFANVGGKYSALPTMTGRQMFDGGSAVQGSNGIVSMGVANLSSATIPANSTRYIRFTQGSAGTATNVNTNAYWFIDLDNVASPTGNFVWNDGSTNFNGFNLYTNQLIGINQ